MGTLQPEDIPEADWERTRKAKWNIDETYHHRHSKLVLDADERIRRDIVAAVESVTDADCIWRKAGGEKYRGIGSQNPYWDDTIRERLGHAGWSVEVTVRDGVVYDEAFGGEDVRFDIAKYDLDHNLSKLWDVCFGERPRRDGKEVWEEFLDQGERFNARGQYVDTEMQRRNGQVIEKEEPTVLGEIQNGNWALRYRDFLKLIGASTQTDVDLFVYIVPSGRFSEMLSDGIVRFSDVVGMLQKFEHALHVPVWVVGIGLDGFVDG